LLEQIQIEGSLQTQAKSKYYVIAIYKCWIGLVEELEITPPQFDEDKGIAAWEAPSSSLL